MRVVTLLFVIVLISIASPVSAEPFTFVFKGTFEGSNLPGGTSNWQLRVTADNGGQTPVGTFHPNDWVRYELETGTYVQVWDPTAGGTVSCGIWACLEISSDGINAQLVACTGSEILLDGTSLCGARDNLSPANQDFCLEATCGPGVFTTLEVRSASGYGASLVPGGTQTLILQGVVGGAPDCSEARASIAELWPPDRKMVAVRVDNVVDPDGDPVSIEITGVTSDELADGVGSGDTCPDAIVEQDHVLLRAERSGQGNGRVYTVQFTATDPSGLSCAGSVDVCVPHDRRLYTNCIKDDAITEDATSCTSDKPREVAMSNVDLWVSRGSGADLAIRFSVETPGPVELTVYDLRGRRVCLVARRDFTLGVHTISWNGLDSSGREVATGLYLVRLLAEQNVRTVKAVWVRN